MAGDDDTENSERLSSKVEATATDSLETITNYEWGAATKTAVLSVLLLPALVLGTFLSVLPPAWRIHHKIHKWSAYQMQKAANADTLANVRRSNGHEDVLPAAWVEGDEDEKDRTGWAIKGLGDKRYDRAVHGRSTSRMGKANLIHVNEDDSEQGTWAEAAIDNALQLDRERYLFRDAQLTIGELHYAGQGNGQNTAVADGGQPGEEFMIQDISVERPGILQDILVPVNSRQGYDGQVVSWNQYRNLKSEQSDQQTIRDAKNSAWAAAKLDDIEGADLFKWLLVLGGIGFVLLFHAEIGAFIAGLSGGGGGGGAVGGALGMMSLVGMPGGI